MPGNKDAWYFMRAWFLHQKRNDHHWEWHLLVETSPDGLVRFRMPVAVRKEMVCDWIGAGKAKGFNDALEWYTRNSNDLLLHSMTREAAEKQLVKRYHGREV